MKKLKQVTTGILFLVVAVMLMSFITFISNWKIENNHAITFRIKYMFGQTCNGNISGLSGDIDFDPEQPEKSSFNVKLNVSSIKTGNSKRDEHLQQEEYFNEKAFPTIQFKSTQVNTTPTGFTVTGDLTIKGITKSIAIPFTFKGSVIALFEGDLEINRLDYGVGKKNFLLKNKVVIHIVVPVSELK